MTWVETINEKPIKAIRVMLIIITMFIIISLVLAFILNRYFLNIPISDILAVTLGALALPLGAISLAVSMVIASRQDMQLSKLKKIGEQTSDTVNRLTTDSSIQNRIKKFFYNYGSGDLMPKYKCIYPVSYIPSTPLPQVSQADFYVFHVLGSFMDEKDLDILGIPSDTVIENGKSLNENTIFICTKNPWLNKFYEIKNIKTDEDLIESRNFVSNTLKLPCWFVNDLRGISEDKKRNIKILVSTEPNECGRLDVLLESPANEIYRVAQSCGGNIENDFINNIQSDYAIFARFSKSNYQHIIIAGIHQYGTWIVGELLNSLICGKEMDYYSIFLDNNDFICIVTGEFSQIKLKVKRDSIQIYKKYFWVKEADRWARKYTDKEENNNPRAD
jgi:hypothetical protein